MNRNQKLEELTLREENASLRAENEQLKHIKAIAKKVILLEKEVDELRAYNMRRCNNCKYIGKSIDDEPCYDCARKFTDNWERDEW